MLADIAGDGGLKPRQIVLPYSPRRAFVPFHERKQRFACIVVHRRGGKTVAVANDLIRAAILEPDPYAYVAPYRSQAKSVAWDYFKYYAKPVLKQANEAELKITLNTGGTIQLFGADNADAMRGMGFRGGAADEYGDFRPSVWGNVIRPTLSDRKGWWVFMGTPKGHNQFYDVYRAAKEDPSWFVMTLKASQSGLIDREELEAARKQLSQDQYDQEYECSFDAAILGAYYGKEMARVDAEGRIRAVEHDPSFPVHTVWDLGYTDDTAIIFYQNIASEIRVLDCFAESGGTLEDYSEGEFRPGTLTRAVLERAKERGYRYGRHWLPHDARAKTLASDGKSAVEKLARYLGQSSLAIVPNLSIEDGIQAARTALARTYFDHRCNADSTSLVEALRQYQREYDEDKKVFRKQPLHNWASHQSDAYRYLAIAERQNLPEQPAMPREQAALVKLQQMIEAERNVTLDELWAARDRMMNERVRI